jgi:hypothetical protein
MIPPPSATYSFVEGILGVDSLCRSAAGVLARARFTGVGVLINGHVDPVTTVS